MLLRQQKNVAKKFKKGKAYVSNIAPAPGKDWKTTLVMISGDFPTELEKKSSAVQLKFLKPVIDAAISAGLKPRKKDNQIGDFDWELAFSAKTGSSDIEP